MNVGACLSLEDELAQEHERLGRMYRIESIACLLQDRLWYTVYIWIVVSVDGGGRRDALAGISGCQGVGAANLKLRATDNDRIVGV